MQYSSIAAAGAGAVTGAAVVVDVMRAFTTAAWALHLGVDRVVLAGDPDPARYLKRFLPGAVACSTNGTAEVPELDTIAVHRVPERQS